jgi:hypothetical protein
VVDSFVKVAEALVWIPQVILLFCLAIIISYAADRDPPYKLISSEPVSVKPGEYAHLVSRVWRDKKRDCSAIISRYLVYSDGSRVDLGISMMSDEMIDELESKAPNKGDVKVFIPQQAVPGPAEMKSVLIYRCNFVHSLWPIEVTVSRPITILPP